MLNKIFILIFISCGFLLSGCASTPKYVKSDDLKGINKFGIITILKDKDLKIIDLRRIRQKARSNNYNTGALGALLTEGVASIMVNLTVDSVSNLQQELSDYSVKKVFDDIFIGEFQRNLEGKDIPEIAVLNIKECSEISEEECLEKIKHRRPELDAIIKIDFIYGLGAFKGQKPQPAIDTKVKVINLRNNKALMHNNITFTALYLDGHSIDEYEDNKAELFKSDFKDVAESYGRNLAGGYIF